jgi:hypothetical protein
VGLALLHRAGEEGLSARRVVADVHPAVPLGGDDEEAHLPDDGSLALLLLAGRRRTSRIRVRRPEVRDRRVVVVAAELERGDEERADDRDASSASNTPRRSNRR